MTSLPRSGYDEYVEHLNTTCDIIDLEEARGRLDDVRPIVESIMGLAREIAALQEELRSTHPEDERVELLNNRDQKAQLAFRDRLVELNALGGVLKDPVTGLVDFYTWMNGDLAVLCWRHGEESIDYWHGIKEGFRCRKPVPGSSN